MGGMVSTGHQLYHPLRRLNRAFVTARGRPRDKSPSDHTPARRLCALVGLEAEASNLDSGWTLNVRGNTVVSGMVRLPTGVSQGGIMYRDHVPSTGLDGRKGQWTMRRVRRRPWQCGFAPYGSCHGKQRLSKDEPRNLILLCVSCSRECPPRRSKSDELGREG